MRILVVDDEAGIRKALRILLEYAGFQVAEAGNGEEGLRAFRRQPADLVITDLFMPDRDGLEVIRTLRQEFPSVKVIAMSGGGFGGSMNMLPFARRLGAAEVLDKPFDFATVLAAVRRTLNTLAAA
jgi:DNA-binding response OmpR family regulator